MGSALAVDDNDGDLCATARALESAGFSVTSVTTGGEALKLIRESSWDLAVVDLHLAGCSVSGADVWRSADTRGVPCVVLTGMPELAPPTATVVDKSEGYLAMRSFLRSAQGEATEPSTYLV